MLIPTNNLRLSYSGAGTWTACRMKWYWNYIQNIRRKTTGRALQVGAIVHDLLHRYYMGEDLPKDLEAYIQEHYPANEGLLSAEVAYEALTLVNGYVTKYASDPLKIISSEMQIELVREEPQTGLPYTIYMIVDAVARDSQDRLWRFEHKTSSRMDSYYLNGLRGGLQGGIYHWGLNKTMPEPVIGTIYNMLVKTKIPNYQRMPVMMQNTLAERAVQTFDGIARQIFIGDIYPNANSCFEYNRECDYLPLCNQWKGVIDAPTKRIMNSFYQEYKPRGEKGEESVEASDE